MPDTPMTIDTVAQCHPLATAARHRTVPAGATVAEIVRDLDLPPRYGLPQAWLIRGGDVRILPLDMWRHVRPKPGTRVEITYPAPEGPAVVAVAAAAALPYAASYVAGTLLGLTAGTLAYGLTVAAVTVVGSLLINALIPPAQQGGGQGPQNYAITGVQNAVNRYGVYPKVLGRHRMFPVKTATGYSETVGSDIYYRGRMALGWGPVALEDLRIGTTPITEYEGVELEFLNVDRARTLAAMPELADIIRTKGSERHAPDVQLRSVGAEYVLRPDAAPNSVEITVRANARLGVQSYDYEIQSRAQGAAAWTVEEAVFAAATGERTWTGSYADGQEREFRVVVTAIAGDAGNSAPPVSGWFGAPAALIVTSAYAEYADQGATPGWRSGSETMLTYPGDVAEDTYNVLLEQNDPVSRFTRDETASASIDIQFSQGLYDSDDGSTDAHSASFAFRYRRVGATAWTDAGSQTWTGEWTTLIRFSKDITFPTPGEYEIEITRTSSIDGDSGDQNKGWLTAIRSFRDGRIPSHAGIAEIAFRIKASEELSGQVDSLNCIVQQLAPVWTGTGWTVPQPVRHPAWIYLDAIRGPHLRRPVPDARIDLAGIKAWAEEEPHWTCDYVVDTDTQLAEVLDVIAASGRAKRALTDLQYSVIRDGGAGPVRQVFGPRNSWGFRSALAFPREIHGLRCKVRSERLEWEEDEVLVFMDGYDARTATELETLDLPGVVVTAGDEDEGNAYRLGRYHLAVSRTRTEVFEWHADWEHIRIQRGDKVQFVHDVPKIGVGTARIAEAIFATGTLDSFVLDDLFDFEAATFRVTVRGRDGTRHVFQARSPDDPATRTWTWVSGGAPATGIAAGDLVVIEELTQESQELLITGIYPGPDESARITAVDASPEVLEAATGAIPPYAPIVTEPRASVLSGPVKPVVVEAVSGEGTKLVAEDGTVVPRIAVTIAPVSTFQSAGVSAQLRWRRAGTENPWAYGVATPVQDYTFHTGALLLGRAYTVEVRTVDARARSRGWVAAGEVLASADPVPPPVVTGFDVAPLVIADSAGADRRPALRLTWTPPPSRIRQMTWAVRVQATGQIVQQGGRAEAQEGETIVSGNIVPGETYEVRMSHLNGAAVDPVWTVWLAVVAPDVRFSAVDLVDELGAKIDAAFERHDAELEEAEGVVAELRDAAIAAYGDYRLLEGRPSLLDRVEGLVPAQDDLADRLETVAQQVSWGLSRLAQTDRRMADAGIIVNPETGLVEIAAVHRIDQRIGEVSITADAALAELSLKASYAEVNQAITEALLDPTQLPVLDDLQLRVSTAEAELDAVEGAIALKADTVRVDGIETELGSAEVRIGSLETTIALKADRATLEDALTRLSTAEVRIETLDGANITQTVQDTRRQTDEIDTSAFQTFNDLWQGFRERNALREGIAFAQSEIYASVNEQFAAEAGAREALGVRLGDTAAALETERRTRVDGDAALAESIAALEAELTSAQSGITGNAAAISSLSATVTQQGNTLTSQAADLTELQAGLAAAEDDIAAQGSALSSLTTTVTQQGSSITSQSQQITDLRADLEDAEAGIAANATAYSGLSSTVSSLGGQVSSLSSSYTALQAEVNDNAGRIDSLAVTRVTADGAVSAINTEISATYGDIKALASDTAFTRAAADRVSAGYIWRLNGQSVLELVSVQDGTSGPQVTAEIAADYVRIRGLTQVDNAVIASLAASNAFVSNLTVDTLNIAGNAVVLPVFKSTQDVVTATSEATWVSVISSQITRAGVATRVEFGGELDGQEPGVEFGEGAVAVFEVRRNGVAIASNLPQATGYRGARTSFSFKVLDPDTGTGLTTYEVFMRRQNQLRNDKVPRAIRPFLDLIQFKR